MSTDGGEARSRKNQQVERRGRGALRKNQRVERRGGSAAGAWRACGNQIGAARAPGFVTTEGWDRAQRSGQQWGDKQRGNHPRSAIGSAESCDRATSANGYKRKHRAT